MSWITEHQRTTRIVFIALLVVAFVGPWVFDRVNVPAEFECSEPAIRLEGDFCGHPMNGFQFIRWLGGGYKSIIESVLSGDFSFPVQGHELWIGVLLLFPILPVVSTLLLRGDRPRMQVFSIIAWGLALYVGLFLALNHHPALWKAWGLWLFILLAIAALILEILFLKQRMGIFQNQRTT